MRPVAGPASHCMLRLRRAPVRTDHVGQTITKLIVFNSTNSQIILQFLAALYSSANNMSKYHELLASGCNGFDVVMSSRASLRRRRAHGPTGSDWGTAPPACRISNFLSIQLIVIIYNNYVQLYKCERRLSSGQPARRRFARLVDLFT